MDSPDLLSLLAYFDDKIAMIVYIIPLVRLCNHKKEAICYPPVNPVLGRQLGLSAETLGELNPDGQEVSLPDLAALTDMVLEMKAMILEMSSLMAKQEKALDSQQQRIYMRIGGLKDHIAYLSKNLPPFFVQSSMPKVETKAASVQRTQSTTNGAPRNAVSTKAAPGRRETTVPVASTTTAPTTKKKGLPPPAAKSMAKNPRNLTANMNKTADPARDAKSIKKAIEEKILRVPVVDFLTTEEFQGIPAYVFNSLAFRKVY